MVLPSAYAKKHKVSYPTVMKWIQQGRLPDAKWHEEPIGHYLIPENAPKPATKMGRPKGATKKKSSRKK